MSQKVLVADYVIHTFPHADTTDDDDGDGDMNQDKPPPLSSDEDIELGDLIASPKNDHVEQYEDDLGGGEDGNTALLGGTSGVDSSGWRQVSSIVLEVRVRSQHNESVNRVTRLHRALLPCCSPPSAFYSQANSWTTCR